MRGRERRGGRGKEGREERRSGGREGEGRAVKGTEGEGRGRKERPYAPLLQIPGYATDYYHRRRLASEGIVTLGVRHISLGGEGNALYPVLSSYCVFELTHRLEHTIKV